MVDGAGSEKDAPENRKGATTRSRRSTMNGRHYGQGHALQCRAESQWRPSFTCTSARRSAALFIDGATAWRSEPPLHR